MREVRRFKTEQLCVCLSSRFTLRPLHCEDAPLTAAAPCRPGLREQLSEHAHADMETHKRAFRLTNGICVWSEWCKWPDFHFSSLCDRDHLSPDWPNLGIMSNLRWNWCQRGERSQIWSENRKKTIKFRRNRGYLALASPRPYSRLLFPNHSGECTQSRPNNPFHQQSFF